MYVWVYIKKCNIYKLSSIRGFRYMLGVLEYVLTEKGSYCTKNSSFFSPETFL